MSLLSKIWVTFLTHIGVRNPYEGLPEIKFHNESVYFNEHGRCVVTNYKLGLVNQEVPFVYWGEARAPKLDGFQMDRLIAEAKRQGYIFHHLVEYGTCKIVELNSMVEIHEFQRAEQQRKLKESVDQDLAPMGRKKPSPMLAQHSAIGEAMKVGT